MIISHHSRDLADRRSPAICKRAAAYWCLSLLALQVIGGGKVLAQPSAFAPPPPPSSSVRGINDPAHPTQSPATIAPVQKQTNSPSYGSTNGSTTASAPTDARLLEGGQIIARVDGQIVLASEVMWQVNKLIEANRERIPPQELDKVRHHFLRQQVMTLIDTKLLYADFLRTVPPENIPKIEENLVQPFEEHEIPRLIEVLEVDNRRELVDQLERYGSSLADVQRYFNEKTIAGEWLRQMTPKPQPVTHEQMLKYYQEHSEEYEFPAQARWEELMVRLDRFGGDRTAAWRAIAGMGNEVWQQVAKNPGLRGAVFVKTAKERSHGFNADEGGQHDWTTRGALRSEAIDEALFSLQVGQMSNIIESEIGFHIVRVLERKDAGRTPFVEAQAEIRKQLENDRRKELVQAELAKLRKQSRVWTIFDGDLRGPELAEILNGRTRR